MHASGGIQATPRGNVGLEGMAAKLAGLTTSKKDQEGRRPSNLILPEDFEYKEDLTDVEFHEPLQLAVVEETKADTWESSITVAISIWETSASTPIQVKELELEGVVDKAQLSLSDDGRFLLFPYKNNWNERKNMLAVVNI